MTLSAVLDPTDVVSLMAIRVGFTQITSAPSGEYQPARDGYRLGAPQTVITVYVGELEGFDLYDDDTRVIADAVHAVFNPSEPVSLPVLALRDILRASASGRPSLLPFVLWTFGTGDTVTVAIPGRRSVMHARRPDDGGAVWVTYGRL